jgi:hypothetical protein
MIGRQGKAGHGYRGSGMEQRDRPKRDAENGKRAPKSWDLTLSIVGHVLVIGGLIFAGLQWQDANGIADQAVYQRMAADWKEHLQTFVDKPGMRPYFEEKKELGSDEQIKQSVLAVADVRLHVMDSLLAYSDSRWAGKAYPGKTGWNETFARAFRASPALCFRMNETKAEWDDELVKIFDSECKR